MDKVVDQKLKKFTVTASDNPEAIFNWAKA